MQLTVEQLRENNVSSLVIMAVGLFGMAVNLHVILALRQTKTFGYAFGRICMSHTVANFGNAFVFACFVAPISLIDPDSHESYLGMRTGQLLILFWNASVLSHFLTAVNRCMVIFFPVKVETIFTKTVTDVTIVVLWIFSIGQVVPYFSTECLFDYHIETFTFHFGKTYCSYIVGTYTDYYFSICIICSIGALDTLTFLKIRLLNRSVKIRIDLQQRRRKEIRFSSKLSVKASPL